MKRIGATLAVLVCSTSAYAGSVQRETHGAREFRVYTPDGNAAGRPLVVILHGCTQTADGIADASRMDALADEKGFVVAYPEQTSSMGLNKCWEWWDPANQKRDSGEPKEIAEGVVAIADGHGLDRERVYVAGISAGGGMSVVLGATYPDRFAAIGVLAGVEYAAATSLAGVFGASSNGGPDPKLQGERAHDAMGTFARAVPALVIHGDADGVVAPVNGEQVTAQWVRTNTLVLGSTAIGEPTTTTGEAGYPFTRKVFPSTTRGGSVVEHLVVSGLGHAWPGGKEGGSFADARGPDASRTLWTFFEKRTLSQPIPDAPTADPTPAPAGAGKTTAEPASSPSSRDDGCSTTQRAPSFAALFAIAVGLLLRARRRRATTT